MVGCVRRGEPEASTGVPPGEAHHISFLEPHKHFQNAITVLQKRPPELAEPRSPSGLDERSRSAMAPMVGHVMTASGALACIASLVADMG